ncbi:MAG: DUF1549 and DUF1553 domain-containing protein [Terriglobia bacterium]
MVNPKLQAVAKLFVYALPFLLVGLFYPAPAASETATANASFVVQKIQIYPETISLSGQRARQQIVVQAYDHDGYSEDITSKARLVSEQPSVFRTEANLVVPVSSGTAQLKAEFAGFTATAKVTTQKIEEPPAWDFRSQVIPVFTKSGCNMGACHGAAAGKTGFKLTLRGFDPDADYLVITRESEGRRVSPQEPGRSLILLKATLSVPHGGGSRFGVDSPEYQIISQWISEGTRPPRPSDRRIQKIDIQPALSKLHSGARQQLIVNAYFNDGSVEDVTRWTRYETTNSSTAVVDERGGVELKGNGEASITAMMLSKVAVATVVVPYPNKVDPALFSQAPRNNFIDELVLQKLALLNIEPSGPSSDSEFIRRVSLDATGTLPKMDRVKQFLADPDPAKRQKLIDRLLNSEAYVDYWAYKWSDLLLLSDNKAINQNKKLNPSAVRWFYDWIRESVAQNKPWDQMVRELLVSTGSSRELGALNFYQLHKDPIGLTENTTVAFMGLRLTCARCHNHPLEKWTQVDYFKMANLFARVRQKSSDVPGEIVVYDDSAGDLPHPRLNRALPPAPLDGKEISFDSSRERREALAAWLTSPENVSFSRTIVNRVWANYMGRGLANPVDDIRSTNPPSNEPLMNALVKDFVEHGYDVKHLAATIMNSATYQRTWKSNPNNLNDDRYGSHYLAKRLSAEVILDAVSQVTRVPTEFPGYPPGTRALQLPDTSVASYFLDIFGRPQRAATCECERDSQPNLRQALHVINGETMNQKLASPESLVSTAVEKNIPNSAFVEQLYLAAFSRYPGDNEKTSVLKLMNESVKAEDPASRRQVLEDFTWAVLTSKEFIFNH